MDKIYTMIWSLSWIGKQYNDMIAYAIRFLWWLRFTLPIWFFFYTQYLWFSVELSTFMAVLWVWVSILFEVPTGTRADKYWRKKVYLRWLTLSIIWFIPYLVTKNFIVLVIWHILWWIWGAIISWCLSSLIYDRYQSFWEEKRYKEYSRISSSLVFIGRGIATIIWSRMFIIHPLYPYIALMCCMVFQRILWQILYEPEIDYNIDKRDMWAYIRDWWKHLIASYSLNTLIVWFSIWYFFGSLIRWLYQPFLEDNQITIQQIGLFYAVASFISFIWSYLTKHWYKKSTNKGILTLIYLWMIALCSLSFLLFEWYRIFVGVIFIQLAFWSHVPITSNAINELIPSSHRATVNSIHGIIDTAWRFIGGSICWILLTRIWFDRIWTIVTLWSLVLMIYSYYRMITINHKL